MARGQIVSAFLFFFFVLFVLQVFFIKEGFEATLYGAQKGKKKGEKCIFDPECASNTCLPFDSAEGPKYTCL
jgi:hypothetical protein